jgi:uncharacterized protein (TIGR03067 family)
MPLDERHSPGDALVSIREGEDQGGGTMRTLLLVGWIGLLLWSGLSVAEDKPKTDQDAIQGAWELVARTEPAKPDVVCERVVFKGDKLTFHYRLDDQRSTSECTFKLDPTAKPKKIDFTPTAGDSKGKVYLGIYEFKDGELCICYRGPGSTRPKGFDDVRAGNNVTVGYTFAPERKK